MRKFHFTAALCLSSLLGCAHTAALPVTTCDSSPAFESEKSFELLKLAREDQIDRSRAYDSIDWAHVNPADLQRRIRVAQIFAEGCFKTGQDYASAALIFQHGTTADHYFQAFIWANEAVKRGDASQRMLAADAIDRYLVASGRKQLFGTQFSKSSGAKFFCVQPIEPTFPEARRLEYLKMNRKDYVTFVFKTIGAKQSFEETKNCDRILDASPAGTVVGLW
jgi:hypothetical protein